MNGETVADEMVKQIKPVCEVRQQGNKKRWAENMCIEARYGPTVPASPHPSQCKIFSYLGNSWVKICFSLAYVRFLMVLTWHRMALLAW